jgi:hypothetical protein
MKKLAIILGLAFSLAAMQSTFADDGSGVVKGKKKGKKGCCTECQKQGWDYGKFQKH